MNLLLVNTSINSGSTGRIAEEIGRCAKGCGFNVYAGYGRVNNNSSLKTIRIGTGFDIKMHGLVSRFADRHGFGSAKATKRFVKQIESIKPDIVNLHNIHGYYLNIQVLAEYLRRANIPVVWTFHDCWPFTGHCSYFDAVNCAKWKTGCENCPNQKGYPSSIFIDNSSNNYINKKSLFTSIPNLTIVTPSQWMADNVKQSFLGGVPIKVIYNGVDADVFKPASTEDTEALRKTLSLGKNKVYLGVASVWDKRKGLNDFIQMASGLHHDESIVLIGLNEKQRKLLPTNIIGVSRTENVRQLATYYSMADVFINPTYVDNFPTTNIEALACGTPVITYNTGGSPEALTDETGRIVEKAHVEDILEQARNMSGRNYTDVCRERAVSYFDSKQRFNDYINLFKELCTTTISNQK